MINPVFIFVILVPLSVFYLTAVLLYSLKLPKALFAGSIFFAASLYVAINANHWMPAFIAVSAILLFFAPKMKRNKKERLISTSLILTLTALFALTYTLELRRDHKLISAEFYDIQVTQDEANPEIGYVTYKTKSAPRGSGVFLNLRCNAGCYHAPYNPEIRKNKETEIYKPNATVPLKENTPLAFAWPEKDLVHDFELRLSIRGIDTGLWVGFVDGYRIFPWIPYTKHNEPHSLRAGESYASTTIQVKNSFSSD